MKLNFVKTNPTDNMTVFIMDPVPIERHRDIAKKIIGYGNLYAEQVGFMEHPTHELDGHGHAHVHALVRLRMMGGEFCGNATRALAAVLVDRDYPGLIKEGGQSRVDIDVLDHTQPVTCWVKTLEPGQYHVAAEMPKPLFLKKMNFQHADQAYTGHWVKYNGISHVVFLTREETFKPGLIDAVKNAMVGFDGEALGIMLYNDEACYLTPIVHIPETETEIWERGCGSGSSAVATVMAAMAQHSVDLEIKQPGGVLHVSVEWRDGLAKEVILSGVVNIVAEGMVHL